jgi:hypothetical protein
LWADMFSVVEGPFYRWKRVENKSWIRHLRRNILRRPPLPHHRLRPLPHQWLPLRRNLFLLQLNHSANFLHSVILFLTRVLKEVLWVKIEAGDTGWCEYLSGEF